LTRASTKEKSAGAVVYRHNHGDLELLVIKDRFGAWTLPKGLVEEAEGPEQAAVREAQEETGIEAQIERELGKVQYWYTRHGHLVHKTVQYYLARAVGGSLSADEREIEAARWVKAEEFPEFCDYEDNKKIYREALSALCS